MSQRHSRPPETLRVACRNCALATFCLPMGLAAADLGRLDEVVKRTRTLYRGDLLFRGGDRFGSLYVVKAGALKSVAPTGDGDEQVLGFHLPGEVIGLEGIDRQAHGCAAVALETAVVCEILFARLEELSAQLPSLQRHLYRLLSKEIGRASELLRLLGKKGAEARLAAFLLGLSKRLECRGQSPTDLRLCMSRHEIANYLGLAVETVSRLFTRFQDEGVMGVERRHIEIRDLVGLEALAEGSSQTRQHPGR